MQFGSYFTPTGMRSPQGAVGPAIFCSNRLCIGSFAFTRTLPLVPQAGPAAGFSNRLMYASSLLSIDSPPCPEP